MLGMAVMIALAVITYHVLFKEQSLMAVWTAVREADLGLAGLGVLAMFVFVYSQAAILRVLMRTFHRNVSRIRSLQYSLAGFYFSAVTPSATGGQPMQLFYMMRDGEDFAHASFTLLTVTAVYQMTVLIYGVVMILAKWPYIIGQPAVIKWLIILGILANGIASACILLMMFCRPLVERISEKVLILCGKFHLVRDVSSARLRVKSSIEEYSKGGIYLRNYPAVLVKVVILTVVQLTALYSVPYFAFLALGINGADFFTFISMQAVLSLAVSAVPLPGSVGASEGSFMMLYQAFIAESRLLPMMALSRGISFYGLLLVSGIVVLWLHFHKRSDRLKGSGRQD